jgi:hypothetical protein
MRSNDINLFQLNIAPITVVMAFDRGARRATNGRASRRPGTVWRLLARGRSAIPVVLTWASCSRLDWR